MKKLFQGKGVQYRSSPSTLKPPVELISDNICARSREGAEGLKCSWTCRFYGVLGRRNTGAISSSLTRKPKGVK